MRINLYLTFVVLLFFTTYNLYAINTQEDEPIIFKVTSYKANGKNYDKLALEKEVHLTIYPDEDEKPMFANVWGGSKADSYSIGNMYEINIQDYEETDKDYASQVTTFIWNFKNSYDDETGTAKVTLTRVYTEEMIKFTCVINSISKNEELVMQGYQIK